MKNLPGRLTAVLGVVLLTGYAQAATVTYILGDHPDAGLYKQGGDPYGLRYDAAAPPGDGPTFSVGSNLGGGGGVVTLSWDPLDLSQGAVITGVVQRDDDDTLWDVTYTLTGLAAAGSGGFTAQGGSGAVDEQGGLLRSITLTGESNGSEVFEFDNDGHRLPGDPGVGWVGRGWLLPNGSTDDWLVTGTLAPIPLPAAAWLFGSAIGLLGWLRAKNSG